MMGWLLFPLTVADFVVEEETSGPNLRFWFFAALCSLIGFAAVAGGVVAVVVWMKRKP